jgi:hypothetical protein
MFLIDITVMDEARQVFKTMQEDEWCHVVLLRPGVLAVRSSV